MIRFSLVLAAKDLRLLLRGGAAFAQALLLGLLLIFLFSLAASGEEAVGGSGAAVIFWLASAFCQTLIFTALYAVEEGQGQRLGLLLAPVPVQALWLGKALAGLAVLALLQLVFLIALAVFLGRSPESFPIQGGAMLALADIGIAASGSLLGALARGRGARESLCSILLFPLLIPLLLGAVRVSSMVLAEAPNPALTAALGGEIRSWMELAAAFDAIFLAAALVLFPFVYGEEG